MTKSIFITAYFMFASFVFIATASAACDITKRTTLEIEKNELIDLNSNDVHVTLYNFRLKECASFSLTDKETDTSVFLPSDETTLGMYQVFRDKGDNQIEALKHTLEFNIYKQQS